MENWEQNLSDKKPEPETAADPENLFIVEGLKEGSEPDPQIFSINLPGLSEDESSTEEMSQLTVNLGVPMPEAPVEEPQFEYQAQGRTPRKQEIVQDYIAEVNEEMSEAEAQAEVAASSRIPKLYWVGSLAAVLICVICYGVVWMKKSKEEEIIPVAFTPVKKAPVKPVPAPGENAGEEKIAGMPNELVESHLNQTGMEKSPEGETTEKPMPTDPTENMKFTDNPLAPEVPEVPVVSVPPTPVSTETPLGKNLSKMFGELVGVSESEMTPPSQQPALPETPVVAENVAKTPVVSESEKAADPSQKAGVAASTLDPSQIRRGDALVQLKNGNLFAGRIMNIKNQSIVLRMTNGELLFALEDVAQVLPAGAKGSVDMYPSGYVELTNGNRLWGKILDQGQETVTVATGAAKIVVARSTVSEVKLGVGITISK